MDLLQLINNRKVIHDDSEDENPEGMEVTIKSGDDKVTEELQGSSKSTVYK